MTTIWAEQALTPDGWRRDVAVSLGRDGVIEAVMPGSTPSGTRVGALLAAPVNLHSHAFQRAMAGMTETRGPDPRDTFWTWRKLMFRFLEHLTPDDVEAIAALVQMEMLEAGYAAVAEFHYLHHQPDGTPYANPAEMAARIAAAAAGTGIGLTLLPVLYQYGGCDERPLAPGQVRFGNDPDAFHTLFERSKDITSDLPSDTVLGVAPHSLRAVGPEGLRFAINLTPDAPLHMHIAEQAAEVDEVLAHWGKRPVEWLFDQHNVGERWCLIHATQMLPHETEMLAKSGAVVGLCPITESNLGDGIFDGLAYAATGGRFGIGSDSNIRISLSEELRMLEYSQRLRDRIRAAFATPQRSAGRVLFETAVAGGAQAAARCSGAIAPGALADLMALNTDAIDLAGKQEDGILDAYIFAGDDRMVTDVWSAGRHQVQDGRHVNREKITARYRKMLAALKDKL